MVTPVQVPLSGKVLYRCLPIRRRVVLDNLRRAFGGELGDDEIIRLAQAFYGHLARFAGELLRFPFLGEEARRELVRIENEEAMLRAASAGKGVLVLTGHFGNWEVATLAGIARFPRYRGRFHVLRRPIRPRWIERLLNRRFRRAGLHVLPKLGSLDAILDRLAANDAVVFVLDQHAGGRDGVAVDFLGSPASTFRSLAVIALATGAPVVPLGAWREPDGRHVIRFEEPLPLLDDGDPAAAIRANTRGYNAALERILRRHPEQWFWMHRRWKDA